MKPIEAPGYSINFNEFGYEKLSNHIQESNYSGIFIITDSNCNENCLGYFLQNLATEITIEIIEIEPGEENKSIETCIQVWNVLTDLGADRKSLIINLGGGVITDLGGFVASTYKRGIAYINVPTTLLAMVDASVGGKNGVDLGVLKNQIGVISNPKMVLIDTYYLQTLQENQMRSGLAEMLKHGLIFDKNYWDIFQDLTNLNTNDLEALIYQSVEIKNKIVSQDFTENGIRKALNFGHTLGHAIESYFLENETKNNLLHGEAIAAGMVMEAFLSKQKNLISAEEYYEIKTTILSIFNTIPLEENDLNAVIDLLVHDKKNEFGVVKFALLNGIGNTMLDQTAKNDQIREAFLDYKS
ncbi:3-dehydroquinate synthase [Flavobacterium sp. NST-5]|uniref:3-dehydroquinate synthase n=1 Tax=Flavobacterium ichthyis TaxID=2698827 RepID=A0ABW9Z8B7_9FLAO|nr:3-dehydroquinate synthase [Flavobacterium ichthyis]NBL65117.1 3-dehydroquinate synthase [Flavobacterium ichthyis]